MKALLTVGLSENELETLREGFADRGWEIRSVPGWNQVFLRLRERLYEAVLCEANLPDGDWRDVLDELWLCTTPPALIVTSRLADVTLWAEVLDAGGFDVLPSPLNAEELRRALERAGRRQPPREIWKSQSLLPAVID